MLNENELEVALRDIFNKRAISVDGHYCFRNVETKYANQYDIRVTYGSWLNGGRYNVGGGLGVLYLSNEPTTSMEETTKFTQNCSLSYHNALKNCSSVFPLVFVTFDIKLSKVLNLTDKDNLDKLAISEELLTSTDWKIEQLRDGEAKTQVIGRLARKVGFEAILSPSACCEKGNNLNIFCENLTRNSKADVININLLNQIDENSRDFRRKKLAKVPSAFVGKSPTPRLTKSLFRLIL
jgi:RES domain-containing protein